MVIPVKANPFAFLDRFVPKNTLVDSILDRLADKFEDHKPVSLHDGVLEFNLAGDYSFDFLPNGKVKINFDHGATTVLTAREYASIDTIKFDNANAHVDMSVAQADAFHFTGDGHINIKGETFVDAAHAADNKFEPGSNLDSFLDDLLSAHPNDMGYVIDHLTVNGNKADAFKVVWDYLDDGNTYYNQGRAQMFVELGAEYAKYLKDGGAPLLDTVVKYTPDSNHDGTPERAQTMHDNLLGNLDIPSIVDRFFDGNVANNPTGAEGYAGSAGGAGNGTPDEATGLQLIKLVQDMGLDSRPYYGGYEGETNNALSWDIAHGLVHQGYDLAF